LCSFRSSFFLFQMRPCLFQVGLTLLWALSGDTMLPPDASVSVLCTFWCLDMHKVHPSIFCLVVTDGVCSAPRCFCAMKIWLVNCRSYFGYSIYLLQLASCSIRVCSCLFRSTSYLFRVSPYPLRITSRLFRVHLCLSNFCASGVCCVLNVSSNELRVFLEQACVCSHE
jgi:hypothetical protein